MNVVKYRRRNAEGGSPGTVANMVTIPMEIARRIPADVVAFKVRLTDEGILYEPLREGEELDHLPEWTRT